MTRAEVEKAFEIDVKLVYEANEFRPLYQHIADLATMYENQIKELEDIIECEICVKCDHNAYKRIAELEQKLASYARTCAAMVTEEYENNSKQGCDRPGWTGEVCYMLGGACAVCKP